MDPSPTPAKKRSNSSSLLFFIILGVIVAAILAFLIIRPNPSGVSPNGNTGTPPPASQK